MIKKFYERYTQNLQNKNRSQLGFTIQFRNRFIPLIEITAIYNRKTPVKSKVLGYQRSINQTMTLIIFNQRHQIKKTNTVHTLPYVYLVTLHQPKKIIAEPNQLHLQFEH